MKKMMRMRMNNIWVIVVLLEIERIVEVSGKRVGKG